MLHICLSAESKKHEPSFPYVKNQNNVQFLLWEKPMQRTILGFSKVDGISIPRFSKINGRCIPSGL